MSTNDTTTPDVVTDAPQGTPSVEELQAQLVQCQEWRVNVINEACKAASDKGWCSEFDAVMVKIGLEKRRTERSLMFRLDFVVPASTVPEGQDAHNWSYSDGAKMAALEVLESLLVEVLAQSDAVAKGGEANLSAFRSFGLYDYVTEAKPYTLEDLALKPMAISPVTGKPTRKRTRRTA